MALPSFTRINEIVSVQSPTSNGSASLPSQSLKSQTGTSPQTILLLSWSDADPRYIEKYTNLYTELYPSATIILVKSGMADFFWRTEQTSRKLAEPAVKLLRESSEDTLLVHVMSNAGSKQWCTINNSYFRSTGRALSSATTIIDSAPGRSRFKQTWGALAGSLPRATVPRFALGFVFGIVLCLMHLWNFIRPGGDVLEIVREQMNDTAATEKRVRRCYIYSEGDEIIGWEDVEDHARDAERKGWAVELVKFQGSTHVGHLKQNPQRYREAIERTWSGGSR